jgi:hypothetical protein
MVKFSLRLNKLHAMNTYGIVEVQLRASVTSTPDGGVWSVSLLKRSIPAERTAGIQCVLGWTVLRRENRLPLAEIHPCSLYPPCRSVVAEQSALSRRAGGEQCVT